MDEILEILGFLIQLALAGVSIYIAITFLGALFGAVAQNSAHGVNGSTLAFQANGPGSNPGGHSMRSQLSRIERLPSKQNVAGSSPAERATHQAAGALYQLP